MKNTNLVQTIISKRIPCVFVSPHFDDVYLSCGSLIAQLSGKTDIRVITLFTNAHDDGHTLSARQALRDAGYVHATDLYNARMQEDKHVFSHYQVTTINVGLHDALFRKKTHGSLLGKYIPEFAHVYPTYRFHIIGQPAKDDPARGAIAAAIAPIITPHTMIFIPYGIGSHVDHLLARQEGEKLPAHVVYYADFPYTSRLDTQGDMKNKHKFSVIPHMDEKVKMLQLYKTQFMGLFPDGNVPAHTEVFYW